MRRLRGELIGCGFFAINQLHAWADIPEVEIVALCDRDPARLALVGEQFGIAGRCEDAGALFAARALDFVDIATTPPSHRALVELAARHRVPVICQKPFAPTMSDARAMVDAAEAAGIPLMVHENFCWQTPILAMREAILGGRIGEPFWGRFWFRSGYDVFSGQPYLATGERFIIEDLGIHILDVARRLLGDVSRPPAPSASSRRSAARTSPPCRSTMQAARSRSSIARTRRGWRASRSRRPSSRSTAPQARCG